MGESGEGGGAVGGGRSKHIRYLFIGPVNVAKGFLKSYYYAIVIIYSLKHRHILKSTMSYL